MKKAIDLQGNEIEVEDEVVVRTSGGVHYLHTPEEQADYAARLISDPIRLSEEEKIEFNAEIDRQLKEEDIKVVRALVEGDTARIEAHKLAQTVLRNKKKPE